jgi:hypothetical protein
VTAARELPAPRAGALRACGLASLAEAGVVALPVHFLLSSGRAFDARVEAFTMAFVVVYVGAALIACRFRDSRNLAAAAAVAAIASAIAIGGGGIDRTAFAAVVALLVALRLVALGLRDWRTPILAELGWGAVILGFEVLVAAGPIPDWRPALVPVVPLFFAAGLASRATTVWTSGPEGEDPAGSRWVRRTLVATGALALAMATTVALAVRGGLFDVIGRWLAPVLRVVEAGFLWVVVQAARPLFWLADRIGIDSERIREVLERLRSSATRTRATDLAPPTPSPWQRVIGLLVFLAIGYVLYRILRRSRPPVELEGKLRDRPVALEAEALTDRVDPPPRWRFRPELPAEAVRRLYAEVLLDLRERRLVKEPSLTPAEFVPIVASEFPQCADDFGALTRSYQHVRYGNIRLDRGEVRELEFRQRRLLGMLRRHGHGRVGRRQ